MAKFKKIMYMGFRTTLKVQKVRGSLHTKRAHLSQNYRRWSILRYCLFSQQDLHPIRWLHWEHATLIQRLTNVTNNTGPSRKQWILSQGKRHPIWNKRSCGWSAHLHRQCRQVLWYLWPQKTQEKKIRVAIMLKS